MYLRWHILQTTSSSLLNEFLSLLIFFLWIFKMGGRVGSKWNVENSISQPLQFFGYAKHYTRKSYELTFYWYKVREVNAKHAVYNKIYSANFYLQTPLVWLIILWKFFKSSFYILLNAGIFFCWWKKSVSSRCEVHIDATSV